MAAATATADRAAPPPLGLEDLNTTVNHEPRISHRRLAAALGYADERKLLHLGARHREALERFGSISATVAENNDPRRRGRPGKIEWYNKRQALFLCTKAETPRATEVTIEMVEVFDRWLAGVQAHRHTPASSSASSVEHSLAVTPTRDPGVVSVKAKLPTRVAMDLVDSFTAHELETAAQTRRIAN